MEKDRFKILISLPAIDYIIDEDLHDLLYEFNDTLEFINEIAKIIVEIDMHKGIKSQGNDYKNLFSKLIHLEDNLENQNKNDLIKTMLKEVFEIIERLIRLNSEMDDVVRIVDLTYKALDASVESISQFLKEIKNKYEDVTCWLSLLESKHMKKEATQLWNVIEKRKSLAIGAC